MVEFYYFYFSECPRYRLTCHSQQHQTEHFLPGALSEFWLVQLELTLGTLRSKLGISTPICAGQILTTYQTASPFSRRHSKVCAKWCRITEELSSSYWPGFIQHPWKGNPHADHLTAGTAARLEVHEAFIKAPFCFSRRPAKNQEHTVARWTFGPNVSVAIYPATTV